MVNSERIRSLFREEVDKHPNVKQLGSLAQILFCKPLHTVTVLIQVGYEPLPPRYIQPSLFFFSGGYFYPNIYRYMKYLTEREGTKLVLYRGLTPRLGGVFICNTVRNEVLAAIPTSTSKCPPEQIAAEVGRQCAATGMAVLVSHPLLVITNRMIVSLIGKEDKYSTVTGAISTIFSEEGLLGFYAGIIPHLLGEVSGKAVEIIIQELIDKLELNKKLGLPAPSSGSGTVLPVSALHSFLSYPLQLTTTIMSVNNCGMAVSDLPPIQDTRSGWMACLKALWSSGNIKRGSNLMFARKAPFQAWHTPTPEGPGRRARACNLHDCEIIESVAGSFVESVAESVAESVTPNVCADGTCALVVDPVAESILESVVDPVAESILGAVVDPVAESILESVVDPVAESILESVVDPVAESILESVVDPVAESILESVVDPVAESILDSVVDPVAESILEAVVDPVAESILESVVDPVAESILEAVVDPVAESVAELIVDPVAGSLVESVVESVAPIICAGGTCEITQYE